jgi:phosphohistidine phosphatase SixA
MFRGRFPGLLYTPVARAALLLLVLPFAATQAAAQSQLGDAELLHALRGGGYNIYFRHVGTEWSQSDRVERRGDWLACDPGKMRQLSDAGRADAAAIGAAMRELAIPVGEVLASPYCRTMETARLMGVGPVQASADVMNLRSASYFGGREAIVAAAQRLLSSPPPEGANRVIVAHGNVAREATPVYPDEGEGLVFEPAANGFRLVGRLTPAAWSRLAASVD